MKIVSLLPSATEIVYALGLGDDLIGVTDECDFPPDAVTKPVVSRSALPQGRLRSAREIDRAVRERMDAQQPLYVLDTDLLRREQPDVIITQDLCRVCAVPSGQVEQALAAARAARRHEGDLARPADARGRDRADRDGGQAPGPARSAGAELAAALRARVAQVKETARRLPTIGVFCLEWCGAAVRGRPLDPRDGRGGRRHEPPEREGRAVAGGHPPGDPRREARGDRLHAVRLLPGGGGGGGRAPSSRIPRSPTRRRRATATSSRWTPPRSSPGPGPGSSTASRSWRGRRTRRPTRSRPTARSPA